jgi:hypothetical protein
LNTEGLRALCYYDYKEPIYVWLSINILLFKLN